MIIDAHGHFTNAPSELAEIRAAQLTELNRPRKHRLQVPDEKVTNAVQNQLNTMEKRGITHILFSPTASKMGHHIGNELISLYWSQANNDLIAKVCSLFPDKFSGVCQLPQSPGVSPGACIEELDRCVLEAGFVGCNINPDVSGGLQPLTPSLGDEWWYPLWERMVQLDVPGMIHASATCVPNMHPNGSHYITQEYAAVVELCASRVFEDFPSLRLIIPHAGGGIVFQYNRQRALHLGGFMNTSVPFEEAVNRLYFDTAIYDTDSLDMLFRKISAKNIVFGSEMFGTAAAIDPMTGRGFDDIVPIIRCSKALTEDEKEDVFWRNALRIYPRLKGRLSIADETQKSD
jgi:4-oxalmesaconate hydratase